MTASRSDPRSDTGHHELSQNHVSLCPEAVTQPGWALESRHVVAPMSLWMPGPRGGDQQRQVPMVSWREGPLLHPAWCHPRVPGMLWCWGSPRYPGMLHCHGTGDSPVFWDAAQLVAREHHLPANTLHTFHVRLLLFQAASLSHGPREARREVQSSLLPWPGARLQETAGSTPACTQTAWGAGYGPIAPSPATDRAPPALSQLRRTAKQPVGDAPLPAEPRAACDARGHRQDSSRDTGQEAPLSPRKRRPWGRQQAGPVLLTVRGHRRPWQPQMGATWHWGAGTAPPQGRAHSSSSKGDFSG